MTAEILSVNEKDKCWVGFSLKTHLPKIVHGHFKIDFWDSKLHLQKKQNVIVIGAIVSCSGRPSRVSQHLDQVHARPFLIMSTNPLRVSGMNQEAFERLK